MTDVELLILGSGTSQGVPAIGCSCDTCRSRDPRDERLRPSACFRVGGKAFLVDVSSDFRQQMLRAGITRIDAVLMTHHHFDHIGGIDDLRQYNYLQNGPIRVYGMKETLDELRRTFRYAFAEPEQEGGGVPQLDLRVIDWSAPFLLEGVFVQPLLVHHGVLPVLGYRIGRIAYITDTNHVPEAVVEQLEGLDILVLDALRHRPHPTHFHLDQAVGIAQRIGARRTFFTHIAHDVAHERDSPLLPDSMAFAFDGLLLRSGEEDA